MLVGVISLSKSLGISFPCLRFSVIGSITYETVAAGNALEAMDFTGEESATIHGNNERIRIETAAKAVEFYIRLIKQC